MNTNMKFSTNSILSLGIMASVGIMAVVSTASPALAQQSFSFSFGSSSGFSSGSQGPKQERSPGEDPESGLPSASSNGFRNSQSHSVTNVNGHSVEKSFEERDGQSVSITRVRNGKQDVTIEESQKVGIRVTIKDMQRGKEKKSEFQADTRKALKRKHPAAFEWVRKFAAEPNAGNNAAVQGPEAQQMMQKQLEQMIRQSDDPALKQQLQMMLDRLEAEGNGKPANK
jgi:hypothetical protein